MKLTIEVEIEEGKGNGMGPPGALRGSKIKSVVCNGRRVKQELDTVGRADGEFYPLPGPEEDDCFRLELVNWLG